MTPEVILNRRELVKSWLSRTLLNAGSNGVSVAQIAEAMGLSEASVYKQASPVEENQLQAHNLLPLFDNTGDFFFLEEMARLFGFALIPLGEPVEMVKALLGALERAPK